METPYSLPDKLHEECGVFGIVAEDDSIDPALAVYNALFALQHRGQESSGIAVCKDADLSVTKGAGLVPEVFTKEVLASLSGAKAAIGHVRYANSEFSSGFAQPLLVRHTSGPMALCYNGRLSNSHHLRMETETRGGIFQTTSDCEVISHILIREHLRTNTLEDAIINAMHYMIGAYSIVVLSRKKLIAARDPNGYRPLCIGKVGNHYAFASESCAFDALGGQLIRDVEPGEVVVLQDGKLTSHRCGIQARTALCSFELIYFARQDSVIDGAAVDFARHKAGMCLAARSETQGDIVIGVPDSGLAAAQGFAQASGIPYGIGLVKNRYIQRTFIQPAQNTREKSVRIKLNAMASVVQGKRVIMVDDSIVRGTTSKRIVTLLREAGATEVHMKVSSPPFLTPCFFGTAIPDRGQLAASGKTLEEICRLVGADSLQYLATEDLKTVTSDLNIGYCDACFTGDYAVPVPVEDISLSARVAQ